MAQANAECKRAYCGRKTKLTSDLKQVIGDHLRLSWSPEAAIAHECKLATKSIYNWLNHGWINFPLSDLFEHGLTVDHGTEFSGLDVFETQYGTRTYYCHVYSPAERGSNERFNRILRYFYPKGTCFKHVSAQELSTTLLEINQRPFKVLNWQTQHLIKSCWIRWRRIRIKFVIYHILNFSDR